MARKRKSTLGPFPKTLRWRELAERFLAPGDTEVEADKLLVALKEAYERLVLDDAAVKAAVFLAALPVCSRFEDNRDALWKLYGIKLSGAPTLATLTEALEKFIPEPSISKTACAVTLKVWLERGKSKDRLFAPDPWAIWRAADGSAFCDLGREFFTQLNRLHFSEALRLEVGNVHVDRFSVEMSLITRTFSARWFNACARVQVPEAGSIRWYLGHCLGK